MAAFLCRRAVIAAHSKLDASVLYPKVHIMHQATIATSQFIALLNRLYPLCPSIVACNVLEVFRHHPTCRAGKRIFWEGAMAFVIMDFAPVATDRPPHSLFVFP